MAKELLTPNEVASRLGVSPVTVRQWAQKGLIEARTTAGGHRRFTRAAVAAFAARMGMHLADDTTAPLRILVVDDDRPLNAMLVALLRSRRPDAVVASAYDGFEAGREVQRTRPAIVVLDILMPGLDGVEVCRALKADPETAAVRVIAMTGHHTPELEQRVRAAGAEVLLKKPFGNEELIAACGLGAGPGATGEHASEHASDHASDEENRTESNDRHG